MARSREARARRQQRRDRYADEVLARVAESNLTAPCNPCVRDGKKCVHRTRRADTKAMVWDNDLAVAIPNQVSPAQRERIMAIFDSQDHFRGERGPIAAMKFVTYLAAQHEHAPEGGKIASVHAGKANMRAWRTDVAIAPSWAKAEVSELVHTCTSDDQSACAACAEDGAVARREAARTRARH